MKTTVLNMETTPHDESDGTTSTSLPAHAALITSAASLNGVPTKGWYFAILVRAAYSRLEGYA